MSASHLPGCPKYIDPTTLAACTCADIEEEMVVRASRPSPADLIRAAKSRGLITGVQHYSGTAG